MNKFPNIPNKDIVIPSTYSRAKDVNGFMAMLILEKMNDIIKSANHDEWNKLWKVFNSARARITKIFLLAKVADPKSFFETRAIHILDAWDRAKEAYIKWKCGGDLEKRISRSQYAFKKGGSTFQCAAKFLMRIKDTSGIKVKRKIFSVHETSKAKKEAK